jgi:hypothetical protein
MNGMIRCRCDQRTTVTLVILMLAWGVICLPGCDRSGGRVTVTGTVSVDGQPLPSGSISFRPVDMGSLPSSGSGVANGQFSLPADWGPMPGKYRVVIEAFRKTGRMSPGPGGLPGGVPEVAPIKFNEADKLEATIVAGEKNHFEFQLTTAR